MRKRILYYDLLNIVACFCVIALHCNGIVHTFSDTAAWRQALVVETVCYWAVPVFFMLSGATLINYREHYSTAVYIQRRIFRTVIPWLLWSLITLVLRLLFTNSFELTSYSPSYLISLLLDSEIESKYWFFLSLFGIYMGIPFLAPYTKTPENRNLLWGMALLAFITYSCMPVFCKITGIHWNTALGFPMAAGNFLFAILGYLLSETEIPLKWRKRLYIAAPLCVLFRYFMTLTLSVPQGSTNRTFFGYIQFHSVILGCAVFLLFKHKDWSWLRRLNLEDLIPRIASCSFGIYLIHGMVMAVEKRVLDVYIAGWKWRLLGPFMTYLVCFSIVYTAKKIPGLKKLFP